VLGTYLHGLFENPAARTAFVDACYAAAGRERPPAATGASPADAAADLVDALAAGLGLPTGDGPPTEP
jgi:adenosylcobyric acid synthase